MEIHLTDMKVVSDTFHALKIYAISIHSRNHCCRQSKYISIFTVNLDRISLYLAATVPASTVLIDEEKMNLFLLARGFENDKKIYSMQHSPSAFVFVVEPRNGNRIFPPKTEIALTCDILGSGVPLHILMMFPKWARKNESVFIRCYSSWSVFICLSLICFWSLGSARPQIK